MSSIDQPILTVLGIKKSEGSFQGEKGSVEYSNTVVTVAQPFTEEEIKQGAVGLKSTEYKIKGGQFFYDYQHQNLPSDAQLIFKLDVTRKQPVAVLVALDFNAKKPTEKKDAHS